MDASAQTSSSDPALPAKATILLAEDNEDNVTTLVDYLAYNQ